MSFPALEIRNITIRYGEDSPTVLELASCTIEAGERVALLGLNGSGKTTLLMAVAGIVPFSGEILVGGLSFSEKTLPEIRNRIGFLFNVPEDQLLFPTVIDDVAFGLLRRGVQPDNAMAKARQVLGFLNMAGSAEASIHALSHGQKQRVALAGALVTEPPLLLLDEPSAALDPPTKWELAEHLRGLDAGMLIATHDLSFAAAFCTRFLLIENGSLCSLGPDASFVEKAWKNTTLHKSQRPPIASSEFISEFVRSD
ncbi:MAG: ABC transporter ATP-binding protein [Candidatus Ozemobacteraceae bacterium]